MNNLLISPPIYQNYSNTFLNYTTELVKTNDLGINLLEESFFDTQNPLSPAIYPVTNAGNSLIIEMTDVHLEKLNKLSNYFTEHDITVTHLKGFNDVSSLLENNILKKDCLLFAIEVKNDQGFWNEIFGTRETELIKESNIPTLCIPADSNFKSPESMLIFIHDYTRIQKDIPASLIQKFKLDTTIIINDNRAIKYFDQINRLYPDYKLIIDRSTSEEFSFEEYIKKISPSWVAYQAENNSILDKLFNKNINHKMLSANKPVVIL